MFCNTLYKALCNDGSQFFVIQLDDEVCVIESCRKPIVEQHIKLLLGLAWRKRSIPTHSGWLYPLTFDAGKGLKEA